jgi:hypothetical protein
MVIRFHGINNLRTLQHLSLLTLKLILPTDLKQSNAQENSRETFGSTKTQCFNAGPEQAQLPGSSEIDAQGTQRNINSNYVAGLDL